MSGGIQLRLFHSRVDVGQVVEAIEGCFSLEVKDCGSMDVPPGARLNAAELLRRLGRASGAHTSLWLVERKIFFPGRGRIIGCAAGRTALLSRAGLDPETLKKEVLHEVGHLLGLTHCKGECVMSFSPSLEDARAKPSALCQRCSASLEDRAGKETGPQLSRARTGL